MIPTGTFTRIDGDDWNYLKAVLCANGLPYETAHARDLAFDIREMINRKPKLMKELEVEWNKDPLRKAHATFKKYLNNVIDNTGREIKYFGDEPINSIVLTQIFDKTIAIYLKFEHSKVSYFKEHVYCPYIKNPDVIYITFDGRNHYDAFRPLRKRSTRKRSTGEDAYYRDFFSTGKEARKDASRHDFF
jgi:hypothetical protein